MYKLFLKRVLDFLLALIGLFVGSPLIFAISAILFFVNKSGVFFSQNRIGLSSKVFKVLKFRTMTNKTDIEGRLLSDSDRLTGFGKLIREASLDEIPQLINVLKGDMSLVGPRPLLEKYIHLYNETQIRRQDVRPGITGWAQVNGRNAISWEKKFEYDVWYVDNISFWLDFKILFMTLAKVWKRENIFYRRGVTMEEFKGSK